MSTTETSTGGSESESTGETSDPSADLPSEPVLCDGFDPTSCSKGEKCNYFLDDGIFRDPACFPTLGDDGVGEPCQQLDFPDLYTGRDTCAPGSMCAYVDTDTGTGNCAPLCAGDVIDPTCPEGWTCGIFATWELCVRYCDPLAPPPNCFPGDGACIPEPSGTGFVCSLAGVDGAYGDACLEENFCGHGLVCVTKQAVPGCDVDRCCTRLCDIDAPQDCPDAGQGQTCVPWFEQGMVPPGYESVGACKMP